MIDEVPAIIPPKVQSPTPAPETPPAEATMPLPTAEQIQAADRVFAAFHPNALATLFGVAAGIVLLHDVAVDTFDTSAAEEEETEDKPHDLSRARSAAE